MHLFEPLNEDNKIDVKVKANAFVKSYRFLALILPFNNSYWEELYWFLRFLMPKLVLTQDKVLIEDLLASVDLEQYVYEQKTLNVAITFVNEVAEIKPITAAIKGVGLTQDLTILAEIIAEFNVRYGSLFGQNEIIAKTLFEELPAKIMRDETYLKATKTADVQNTRIAFDKTAEDKLQDLVWDFTDLYKKIDEEPLLKKNYWG